MNNPTFVRAADYQVMMMSDEELSAYFMQISTLFHGQDKTPSFVVPDSATVQESMVLQMHEKYDELNLTEEGRELLFDMGFDVESWDALQHDEDTWRERDAEIASERDAEALASAGWGTDEDYGYFVQMWEEVNND